MKIQADCAVTLRFKLTDAHTRQLLQDGREPIAYLHGGYDNLFPLVEAALDGREPGFQTTVELTAADAFGERDEALVKIIPKSEFPPGVKVGGQLQRMDDSGEARAYTVSKIKGPQVILDGNHPLAGRAVRFGLTVVSVRPATAEEIAHRHVHGTGGHAH